MNNNLPVLPDWCASVLVIFCAMAVLVYIMQRVIEMDYFRRKRIRKKLMKRISESKKSNRLAAFYAAAALGDNENFEYYYATAKRFM